MTKKHLKCLLQLRDMAGDRLVSNRLNSLQQTFAHIPFDKKFAGEFMKITCIIPGNIPGYIYIYQRYYLFKWRCTNF